jgi:hypothetical protein
VQIIGHVLGLRPKARFLRERYSEVGVEADKQMSFYGLRPHKVTNHRAHTFFVGDLAGDVAPTECPNSEGDFCSQAGVPVLAILRIYKPLQSSGDLPTTQFASFLYAIDIIMVSSITRVWFVTGRCLTSFLTYVGLHIGFRRVRRTGLSTHSLNSCSW